MLTTSRRALLLLGAAFTISAPAIAQAQSGDPAAARVGAFYATLTDTMKQGQSLGQAGRAKRLTPVVLQTFNIPVMAQFATGSVWNTMSAGDRTAVTNAFARYTVSSYARNFDSYSGEKFVVDPTVQSRGPDKLVKTQIIDTGGKTTNLNYRMRAYGGAWKIIDIYYNNISQLTTQRSDFASALKSGGAQALIKRLDELSLKLH